MNSFNNVAPVMQRDGTVENFSPKQANQWEVGIKSSLFDDHLTAPTSYYDINVTDVVRSDPDRPQFQIQDGEQFSRGIELNLNASPVNGLNITAGYSRNDSEITRTSTPGFQDRRPKEAGPLDLKNGWISYRFTSRSLKGFGENYRFFREPDMCQPAGYRLYHLVESQET